MFGYILPQFSELKVKEAEFYRSVYCGLCRTMGKTTGQCSRFTLSYDMTFLVLLRLALTGETAGFERFRCPVHPIVPRVGMSTCRALTFSATASGLLVYRKWQDNLADTRGFRRFCYKLLAPFFRKIRRKTTDMAAVADAMDKALASLHALEDANETSADACADKFGDLLAAVVADGLPQKEARIGREIGRHVGRFIYLLDAADDLAEDRAEGAYNPFLAGEVTVVKNTLLQNALRLELAAAASAFELLDVADSGVHAVLSNIFYLGMPRRADEILGFLPRPKRRRGLAATNQPTIQTEQDTVTGSEEL